MVGVGAAFWVFAALTLSWSAAAHAEVSVGQTAVPAPYWAKSIEVVNDGAPVFAKPDSTSRRRGTIAVGTRLAFNRRVFGEGCSTGVWYETSDLLYICEGNVVPSASLPGLRVDDVEPNDQRLPQRYAFIKFDGTRAYLHPRAAIFETTTSNRSARALASSLPVSKCTKASSSFARVDTSGSSGAPFTSWRGAPSWERSSRPTAHSM